MWNLSMGTDVPGRERWGEGLPLPLLSSVSSCSHIRTHASLCGPEELGARLERHDLLRTTGKGTGCSVLSVRRPAEGSVGG